MKLHIGLDDTDSKKGMCTTYLGAVLKERLEKFSKIHELRLVRLNPNIPWKTRGNGAVGLIIETPDPNRAVDETIKAVKKYSSLSDKDTNPGIVFLRGEVTPRLHSFYFKALRELVTIEEAETTANNHSAKIIKFKNGRGVIGALAAIGADLNPPTYELITYRASENWGRPRSVDPHSIFEMDKMTYPETFNNVDRGVSRVLITPHSPCPILFGIRGKNREVLKKAKEMIDVNEPIERVAIFKTNQGTDAHLIEKKISQLRPLISAIVKGAVVKDPTVLPGGHVILTIAGDGARVDCAAYEPTGDFRKVVKKLCMGDKVRVFGGVKETKKLTINLEKIELLELRETFEAKNPFCPDCKKRMESSGRGQGFRCRKCKTTALRKEFIAVKRKINPGLYCVPPRAMRHLSAPLFE
jgi:tRNA(Ile2)-agmatinylcytidine synthase